jgi:hypothetical protein
VALHILTIQNDHVAEEELVQKLNKQISIRIVRGRASQVFVGIRRTAIFSLLAAPFALKSSFIFRKAL